MTVKTIRAPKFQWAFLAPQYWLVWFGMALLFIVTLLPWRVLWYLSAPLAWLMGGLAKKRSKIAKRNIQLAFPDWYEAKQDKLVNDNLRMTAMGLFETGIGWFWPAWRLRRHIEVEGLEHVRAIEQQGKGIFAMAIHNVNAETGLRALGMFHPCVAFYRPHDNKLMDWIQYFGRNRSNKYLIDKRNSKALIQALDQGELCIYLPDQDYGVNNSLFIPFFGQPHTATITATLMFLRRANCQGLTIATQRTKNGYKIKFYPPMPELSELPDEVALTKLNQRIEAMIMEQPESWLWMHKRFKSQPDMPKGALYRNL